MTKKERREQLKSKGKKIKKAKDIYSGVKKSKTKKHKDHVGGGGGKSNYFKYEDGPNVYSIMPPHKNLDGEPYLIDRKHFVAMPDNSTLAFNCLNKNSNFSSIVSLILSFTSFGRSMSCFLKGPKAFLRVL